MVRLHRADGFHNRQWSRGSAALSTSRADAPLASTLLPERACTSRLASTSAIRQRVARGPARWTQRPHAGRTIGKPSRSAASARRSSRVTIGSVAGWSSEATMAAASCSASAARSGCTRRIRIATCRTRETGSTSRQARTIASSRRSASTKAPDRDAAVTLEAGQRRDALDLAAPPRHDFRVRRVFAQSRRARGLGDEQRDEGRRVPEPHRPDRRSSSTASTALAPGDTGGAGLRSISTGGAADPIRMTPARSSRANRPDGSG